MAWKTILRPIAACADVLVTLRISSTSPPKCFWAIIELDSNPSSCKAFKNLGKRVKVDKIDFNDALVKDSLKNSSALLLALLHATKSWSTCLGRCSKISA